MLVMRHRALRCYRRSIGMRPYRHSAASRRGAPRAAPIYHAPDAGRRTRIARRPTPDASRRLPDASRRSPVADRREPDTAMHCLGRVAPQSTARNGAPPDYGMTYNEGTALQTAEGKTAEETAPPLLQS